MTWSRNTKTLTRPGISLDAYQVHCGIFLGGEGGGGAWFWFIKVAISML